MVTSEYVHRYFTYSDDNQMHKLCIERQQLAGKVGTSAYVYVGLLHCDGKL
jgi:hypothetical protein